MQRQTPHLPHWIGWVMANKGNHSLPNLGIMLASKEVRDGRATDTEIVGRAGSCTEQEEEPRGLQILYNRNAVEQQPVGIDRQLELHPDKFIRTLVPRTRMPLSSGRSSKSPDQSFASGSACVQLQAVRRDQVARIRHGSRFVSCHRGFDFHCGATIRPATIVDIANSLKGQMPRCRQLTEQWHDRPNLSKSGVRVRDTHHQTQW